MTTKLTAPELATPGKSGCACRWRDPAVLDASSPAKSWARCFSPATTPLTDRKSWLAHASWVEGGKKKKKQKKKPLRQLMRALSARCCARAPPYWRWAIRR